MSVFSIAAGLPAIEQAEAVRTTRYGNALRQPCLQGSQTCNHP